jgi:hypothetical protein
MSNDEKNKEGIFDRWYSWAGLLVLIFVLMWAWYE